jgi:hypothetical protein
MMNAEPLHPTITVRLVGEDGNAFAILGRCRRAMIDAGLPKPEIDAFMEEARAGDYDHLLRTCMKWLVVE